MEKSRNFCFTLNNYSDEEEKQVRRIDCKYLVFGYEVAATGTLHLQGFLCLKNKSTVLAVAALLGGRAHVEIMRGTFSQAIDYCKKDGHFVEKGLAPVDPAKAMKERWDAARAAAKEGNFDEIPSDMYCRYIRNFKMIRTDELQKVKPPNLDEPCGWWFWGVAGAGKSYRARSENPDHFIKSRSHWWDGYAGQACVIMDEMTPKLAECLRSYLCDWSDIYPFNAETKGGTLFIRPRKFIVTSNFSPEECFPEKVDLDAIRRRFKVVHFPFVFKK